MHSRLDSYQQLTRFPEQCIISLFHSNMEVYQKDDVSAMRTLCRNQRAALSSIQLQLIPISSGFEKQSRESVQASTALSVTKITAGFCFGVGSSNVFTDSPQRRLNGLSAVLAHRMLCLRSERISVNCNLIQWM